MSLTVSLNEGGDEASLFAKELLGMYEQYALSKRWRWELVEGRAEEIIRQVFLVGFLGSCGSCCILYSRSEGLSHS